MELSRDPQREFLSVVQRLRGAGRPFAVATVIQVRGSASAKPGSKAVIDETGKNVWGWVGGGCAESFVGREAVEALREHRTRIVQADLDDEIFGLGMPCGGVMDVFIEPMHPPERLVIEESSELEPMARHLAHAMGFELEFRDGRSTESARPLLERTLFALAMAIAQMRGTDARTLSHAGETSARRIPSQNGFELLILGSSRITEELAKLSSIAKWPTVVYGPQLESSLYPQSVALKQASSGYTNLEVKPGSVVIVASHHKGDAEFITQALASNAAYVGLIASGKRSGLVFEHLAVKDPGVSQQARRRVHAPAGLNLGCRNPQEIALSCIAEVIGLLDTVHG